MKATTKDMTIKALTAKNNPIATSDELITRGLNDGVKHAVYFSTEELAMLEKILYRHATVMTLIADAHMKKGDKMMMTAMDAKARDIEDLAYRIGYPLDQQWIKGEN